MLNFLRNRRPEVVAPEQAALQAEFEYYLGLPLDDFEYVPYQLSMGIVSRTSERPLISGLDTPILDCAIMAVFTQSGHTGLMHISPQTLPEDYYTTAGEHHGVHHTNVPQKYLELLAKLRHPVTHITIVGGDDTLVHELRSFVTGGSNAWKRNLNPILSVSSEALGTNQAKIVIAIPSEQSTLIGCRLPKSKLANGNRFAKIH